MDHVPSFLSFIIENYNKLIKARHYISRKQLAY